MIFSDRHKGYRYITALVAAFPVLGSKAGNVSVMLWCVYSLFIVIKEQSYKLEKKDIRDIIVLSVLYLSYIISYFFATDKHEAGKLLERNIPFLVFPLFMVMNKRFITQKTLRLSLNVYVISCILLCLYVWGILVSQGIDRIFKEDNYYNPVIRNIFSDTTGIHLPYLGMMFVFASSILLYEMLTAVGRNYVLLLGRTLGLVFLLVSVAAFMARTSLFIFFIVAVFFSLKKIKTAKQLLWVGALGLVFTTAILLLPSSQRRIKESLSAKYELPHAGQPSEEVNFRYGVYHCVKEVLAENWLTGVGAGNVQQELNACYSAYTYRGPDDFTNTTYNSHNQYFDIMLKYGIFGLVVFVVSLFWGIKNTNTIYQGFVIIIVIALLTENLFARQAGIIFFGFFNALFFVAKREQHIDHGNVRESI